MEDTIKSNIGARYLWLPGLIFLSITVFQPVVVFADAPVVGMDIPTVDRFNAEQQRKMLDDLHSAGVKVVRTWIVNDGSYDFIQYANGLGIKIELTVPLVYSPGTVKRAKVNDQPSMYPSYPLSSVDSALTGASFRDQLTRIESMGITVVAIEVGNEQNNAAFNGDFKIYSASDPGTRKNMSLQDLKNDPDGQVIAKGFREYVKVLQAVKAVRDGSSLNQHTPILLGGLADTGEEKPWTGARANAVSIKATIQFMRQIGLDKTVDAYGIHTYPWTNGPGQPGPAANRRNRLEKFALSECLPSGQGKPGWITEWGFQNRNFDNPGSEAQRAILVKELMDDFRSYIKQGRLIGLMYYTWARDAWSKQEDPYSIFRNGQMTESGRLAIDETLLR